jgi:hypothetical protein
MPREALPPDILKLIKPQQVRSYALAKGWLRVPSKRSEIALFNSPRSGEPDQLIVPMDETFQDYARRLEEVIENLARVESLAREESISAVAVLNDLLTHDADIVRYRVCSATTARGSIPLLEGLQLLEGAKRSLLAAAHSVVNPAAHHPRMGRIEAQQLINACHLGQTERGSYSVSVACPLRAVDQDQALLPGSEPFTRRTVSLLMRSLARVVSAIDADSVPKVFESVDNEPTVSANLCDALLQMQPQEASSVVVVNVSWATTLLPQAFVPTAVRIKHEYFPIIEDISRKLRPAQAPALSLFVGFVENLGGEPDSNGQMQGEAILSVMFEEQVQPVRAALSPSDWQTAYVALGAHGFVRFKGVLHRGTRVHRITDLSEFAQVE